MTVPHQLCVTLIGRAPSTEEFCALWAQAHQETPAPQFKHLRLSPITAEAYMAEHVGMPVRVSKHFNPLGEAVWTADVLFE